MAINNFCPNCGVDISWLSLEAIACLKCGHPIDRARGSSGLSTETTNSEKSFLATLLLCILLGHIGVHRFYVGKAGTAILMILAYFTSSYFIGIIYNNLLIHGFYWEKLDFNPIGLLAAGVIEVWWLIDLVRVIIGQFKDKAGKLIKSPKA